MRVPAALDWWRGVPGGAAWLDALPGVVSACEARWSLELGVALAGGNVALVLAATSSDGRPVVLKVSFPDEESEHEADALALWEGRDAVALLDRDDVQRALLLERLEPGTKLWSLEDDDEATLVGGALLTRLHRPAPDGHPFRSLNDVAGRWRETIPTDWRATGRAYPRALVELAVDACASLAETPAQEVVLHQDFHGGNVLDAGERGWLAIDPKPLVGDPAFDAGSLLRDRRWALGEADDLRRLRRRLDILAETTGYDRERLRLWGVVHALAWGVSGGKLEADMVRCAELLAAA